MWSASIVVYWLPRTVYGFSSFPIPMLIVSRSARDDAPDGYDEGDIDADSINTELIASKEAVHN